MKPMGVVYTTVMNRICLKFDISLEKKRENEVYGCGSKSVMNDELRPGLQTTLRSCCFNRETRMNITVQLRFQVVMS